MTLLVRIYPVGDFLSYHLHAANTQTNVHKHTPHTYKETYKQRDTHTYTILAKVTKNKKKQQKKTIKT